MNGTSALTEVLGPLSKEVGALFDRMQTGGARTAVSRLFLDQPWSNESVAARLSLSPLPTITVIAGTNGAGKSSNVGTYLRQHGGEYFNPDEIAAGLRRIDPALQAGTANARAWNAGKALLEIAIQEGKDYVFETTLGGNTIKGLLQSAAHEGHRVMICFVGLDSAKRHIQRVDSRVKRGGHPIPADMIQRRFARSPQNLIELLPITNELVVFDNSADADVDAGEQPLPVLLYRVRHKHVEALVDPEIYPNWARSIFNASRFID